MKFLKWLNPLPGAKDFANEFSRPNPYRWRFALVAAATTFAVFSVMWHEEVEGPPAKPDVIWITSFAPHRSDAQIVAANVANQKVKDRLAAEQAARDAEVKNIYRTLGRMSGMDVDKIEREAAAQQAAEQAAKKADESTAGRSAAPPGPAAPSPATKPLPPAQADAQSRDKALATP